ncbi:hypothetical protein [Candidatus Laterigemmans baculatus]|uniref:hypothetical protein n=1 Tax=Candidatus Laterigemmans baculatus TaxID=2770505 RepID=UPI00193B1700|nr:hypothetical protein [Candidatus Laterigemmans baculatus]
MNTGRTQMEFRGDASDDVLRLLKRMYEPGCHPMPVVGYRAEVVQTRAGCLCLLIKERTSLPLLTIAVAESSESADRLWPDMARYFEALRWSLDAATEPATQTTRPAREPWYATLAMFPDRDDRVILKDFCRHYAWGWVERQQRQSLWNLGSEAMPWRLERNGDGLPKPAGIHRRWDRPRGEC